MKKNDWILIGIVILIAAVFFLFQTFKPKSGAQVVEITVDGEIYGTYDLDEEQTIEINGTNTLTIEDGKAQMEEADCPDLLCVHQKAISKEGESIICLPNKVVVTIRGGEETELDAVTN